MDGPQPPEQQLPPRFRQTAFKKYEPIIRLICFNYPNSTTVTFSHGTSETHLCRLRDSITSVLNYRWATDIDLDRLKQLRPHIEFTHGSLQSQVIVRPRDSGRPPEIIRLVEGAGDNSNDSSLSASAATLPYTGRGNGNVDSSISTLYNDAVFEACIILALHSAFNVPVVLSGVPDTFTPSEGILDLIKYDQEQKTVTIYC